jgi:hypothetical protein
LEVQHKVLVVDTQDTDLMEEHQAQVAGLAAAEEVLVELEETVLAEVHLAKVVRDEVIQCLVLQIFMLLVVVAADKATELKLLELTVLVVWV